MTDVAMEREGKAAGGRVAAALLCLWCELFLCVDISWILGQNTTEYISDYVRTIHDVFVFLGMLHSLPTING